MKTLNYILTFGFMLGVTLGLLFLFVPEYYSKGQRQDLFVTIKPLEEFRLTYLPNGNLVDSRYLKLYVKFDSKISYEKIFYTPDKEHVQLELFLKQLGVLKEDNIGEIIPLVLSKEQFKNYGTVEVVYRNQSIEKIKINGLFLKGKATTLIERLIYYTLAIVFSILGVLGAWLVIGLAKLHIIHFQKTGETLELTNSIEAKIEGFKYVLRGFKSPR